MNFALSHRWVRYGLGRIGLPGWLGLAVLAAAVGYAVAGPLPMAERLRDVDRRLGQVAGQLRDGGGDAGPATTGEQLASFYRDFPAGQRIPDILARLHGIAVAQELPLELGEYALTQAPEGRFDRYRVTLPLRGSYRQVRQFAAQALAAIPTLFLENMSLRREQVAEGTVEARVVFVLYLERSS